MSTIPADATTVRPRTATKPLLVAGALAAPLFATASLAQAFTRAGFDLTRHPLSMLSTGDLGWLQITTFVLTGALMIAGAAGLRRMLASRWAPRLLTVTGTGMIVAGIFTMDPGDGFPAGTPAGPGTTLSWHAGLHLAAGTVSFAALIAACFVLARQLAGRGVRIASLVAGTALLAGNVWAMAGGRAGSLTLAIGVIAAMAWISALHGRLLAADPAQRS
ncbi:DUF998 domain-containing protein [Luedemannella helvata]|uniref:DUF998 domain-containing protein n=1 Tax=Luedemannella helvata TaxID=349315 RepID=A0ABP4XBB6_9ACTN